MIVPSKEGRRVNRRSKKKAGRVLTFGEDTLHTGKRCAKQLPLRVILWKEVKNRTKRQGHL